MLGQLKSMTLALLETVTRQHHKLQHHKQRLVAVAAAAVVLAVVAVLHSCDLQGSVCKYTMS
jgi:hypothetical protein